MKQCQGIDFYLILRKKISHINFLLSCEDDRKLQTLLQTYCQYELEQR
jgi:hypothetical protein